jgi:uncharacterized membrane protein YfcA
MLINKIKKRIGLHVVRWYAKFERPISSISLVGGFVFDAVTLKRVDAFWENVWVIGHIVLIAITMLIVNKLENDPGDEKNPEKIHFWLVNIIQFLFGGVLSVFLVFYFRSSDLSVSWPFILLLALAFWANESLKKRFVRLSFQISLLFLSIFACYIFLLPVLLHRIGDDVFILSGIVSLLTIFIFIYLLSKISEEKFRKSRFFVYFWVGVVFISFNVLYFTNIIPPLPLSLKDSGLYFSIEKNLDNNYVAEYEDRGWEPFFKRYDKIYRLKNEPVYAYSAVFSPSKFDMEIIHEWQYYDDNLGEWINYSSIPLKIIGGRDNGFRTFSKLDGLSSGKWRVNVVTKNGHSIGKILFEIVEKKTEGKIIQKILK